MNCSEARRWLSPYLDSELDPTKTFAISEHLRVCDACRRRFDAEREVDRSITGALESDRMPDAVWNDLIRPLRRRHSSRWRLYVPIATAAALALMTWAGWRMKSGTPQPNWAVREFLAETQGGQPFASPRSMTLTPGTSMPLKPFTDLVMNFSGEEAMKHVVQFVRVDTVREADGAELLEVRLNCCGEPVIVRAAHRDRPGRLREFIDVDEAQLASLPTTGKVAIAEREVGPYVLVAVSRHPVKQLLSAMQVQ